MSPDAYLLDTIVVSELVKSTRNPDVIAWVDAHDENTLFISAITLGEIQKGISKLQDSSRKELLQSWLSQDLALRFNGRTLFVDNAIALAWGALQGEAQRNNITLPVVDCLIAATARVHSLTVVTRNVRDMERCGVSVVNPWMAASS